MVLFTDLFPEATVLCDKEDASPAVVAAFELVLASMVSNSIGLRVPDVLALSGFTSSVALEAWFLQ